MQSPSFKRSSLRFIASLFEPLSALFSRLMYYRVSVSYFLLFTGEPLNTSLMCIASRAASISFISSAERRMSAAPMFSFSLHNLRVPGMGLSTASCIASRQGGFAQAWHVSALPIHQEG